MNKPLQYHSLVVVLFFVLCWVPEFVNSQAADNRFIRKINSNDGLSHNIVNDIVQDKKGFIWIATQDGLNKFDGYQFKTYRFNPDDSTSISGNYIRSIFLDDDNNLWVSSRYGLNLYNPIKDNFTRFYLNENLELDITSISTAGKDGLWVCNYAGGFNYFNISNNHFNTFDTDNAPLVSNYIMAIHEDSKGVLWVGTGDSGVQIFKRTDNKLLTQEDLSSKLAKIDITRIEVIFEDNNSNIWIGSREGLVLYHRVINEFYLIRKSTSPNSLSDNIILDIKQDYEGNILIGTQEGGLDILSQDQLKANHPQSFKFIKLLPGSEDYNLSYRSIQTIYEDRDKNLWLGTYGNGLNIIPFTQPKFKLIKHSLETPNTINFDKIWGICEDQEGNLWVGTDGMGLNKYNLITGELSYYLPNKHKGAISDDAILSALCDSKGRLWFGTYAGGLNLYNKNTDSFIHFQVDTSNTTGLLSNDIRCIYEDNSKSLWLGTNGGGLVKMNSNDFSFENIIPQSGGFSAYDIRAIAQDKEGRIWLGTYGVGLFYYHPKTGEVGHFAFDRLNAGTLKCNIIYSLLYDEEENCLWIGGSQNGGLNRLDLNNLTFEVFDEHNGLVNNYIHAIEKDNMGRVWVSTNAGISLFDPNKEQFSNFNSLDGVQEKEFSNGSVLKSDIHNIICFGGSGGLNYFYPNKIQKTAEQTPILITEFSLFDEEIAIRSKDNPNSPLEKTIQYTERLELNHKQNIFTIGFSGIHYSNPEKISYQYMLEGTDIDWNNLGTQRRVTFRNLKSGDYEFKVRASNEDGDWFNNYQSLLISIKPPPWKSWWAYIIYTLALSGGIFALYSYNLKEAKIRHNLHLEKKMRSQENDLHEERIKFFTNISHELRTPLMLLINPLEELLTKESVGTSLGRTLSIMHRSASSLIQLINTLLEFRKAETGKLKLRATEYNIVEQVEENCIAFKGLANKKHIDLRFITTDTNIAAWVDSEKLEMILNNLLSNAIKNTKEKKSIQVQISKEEKREERYPDGKVIIDVIDEGIGIPEEQLDKIFDRFYQVAGAGMSGGTGIGLALTKRLVELHKGNIFVESKAGKGSKFTICLPLGRSFLTDNDIAYKPNESTYVKEFLHEPEVNESYNSTLEKINTLSPDKKKILIVEDNDEIRIYLSELLKKSFLVEEAKDGITGLELARKTLPSLIISDVMMPKMDGVELCKIVKSELQTSHIPVLLITANQTHHIHIDSLEVGADAYLTKPFKADVLISRVYNLLRSRVKLREYYMKKFPEEYTKEDSALSKEEEFLMLTNRIIQKNMGNSDFSITQLHEELGMSRTVFYNKIKSLTNYSPIELIRQMRLTKAAELLKTEKFKIYEVMFQVGFNDEKHFRQLFKNHFGETPSDYVKSNNS